MKVTFWSVLLLAMHTYTFSQQLPLNFSDNNAQFNVWGGSTFSIITDSNDANNSVGEFTKAATSNLQGFYIDLSSPLDLSLRPEISLRFYAFDANTHRIAMKLENGSSPDVEISLNTSSHNMWTTITFDFSTISATGQYSRLVLRINDDESSPGVFLIDDITDGSVYTDPNALDIEYTDLVWFDEFNESGDLDSLKWFKQFQLPSGGSWFNGEQQHYTNRLDNSYVANGKLYIVAKKETYTGPEGITKAYTSARLNSKFAFTYGRIDVRAKLPFGDGTWPAIWTLGKNINETGAYWQTQGYGTTSWPACGEIDVMEHGLHALNEVSSAIHTPSSFGATVNSATNQLSDVANTFHVYSVNWSPNQITFLIDGVGYYTYAPAQKNTNTWPFNLDQYILLNIAMGGVSGAIDPNFVESTMEIDYVRVYQNTLGTTESNTKNFAVYPNPTDKFIHIDANFPIRNFELYNSLGQRILNLENTNNTINVETLESGVYMLKIHDKQRTFFRRVIVN